MSHQYHGHQQGYAPPPGPPPGQSPYPPQQNPYGHPPPQGYPPQQGYPPPQGYPQQQQGGFPPPPGAPYGHPPPGQYGASQQPYGGQPPPPANQSYYGQAGPGAPQHGGYGQPPGGPPPGVYGQPPAGGGYPAQPSPGYGQIPPVDCSYQANEARAAMKGFGTDEKRLIAALVPLDGIQISNVNDHFRKNLRRDLKNDIEGETSGYFKEGLLAIARGPLEQDAFNLRDALKGLGTKEAVLNDVVLGRSNADLNAIKQAYQRQFKTSLESDVKGDLSLKTERLFTMVLAARRNEESAPVIPQQTDQDVQELYRATEGQRGADQITVCSIFSSRSDGQLRAINQAYKQKYHRSLEDVVKKEFSGHMEDALLFMLNTASDKAKHDADMLEATMKGMGTKDSLLVQRLVRIHWDKQRLAQAKAAYKHFYKQDLKRRVEGETSGDFKRLLSALVDSA